MTVLVALPYSPWSERAAWALDARAVPYRARHYQPLFGEPELRRRLGRWRGPVTVPVLIDGETVLGDSLDIARWADARGDGPALFPPDADMDALHALSERGLQAGRVLFLLRAVQVPAAMAELVPRRLRERLGPLAAHVGRLGVRRTLRKYGAASRTEEEHRAVLRDVLSRIRAALTGSASTHVPKTLLPSFSFADITVAQVLAFVSPPDRLRVGPCNRAAMRDPVLAPEAADLLAWRDALYAAHR